MKTDRYILTCLLLFIGMSALYGLPKDPKKPVSRLNKVVYNAIVVRDSTDADRQSYADQVKYLNNYAGRTVGDIIIENKNIFEGSRLWVERRANALHMITREKKIRQDMLFHKGDIIDPVLVMANKQLIRSRGNIADVDFIFVPHAEDTTVVDIKVVTRDSWTISADAKFNTKGESYLELYDKNIFGSGNTLRIRESYDTETNSYGGTSAEYYIPNVLGTFFEANMFVGKSFDNIKHGISVNKEFIKPNDLAGGGSIYYHKRLVELLPAEDTVLVAENFADIWGGYSFKLSNSNSSLFYTARYFSRHFPDRPDVTANQNPYFHRENMIIGSTGIYRERFQTARRINGYGLNEYIAYGYRVGIIGGYSWGEFGDRIYLGAEAKWGEFTSFGYLGAEARIGSYYNTYNGQFHRSSMSLSTNYFTRLYPVGRFFIRQFMNVNFMKGWNRLSGYQESISFTEDTQLRGLKYKIYGVNRLVINTETVLFTPWAVANFKIAMFGYADFGLIGNKTEMFENDFFTTIGLGVRLKNERLVFKTINIRLGIALGKHGFVDNETFRITSSERSNTLRYIPEKADVIEYR